MPPVTGFKWAFGHLIAAAGIIETVLALAALRARTSCRASRRCASSTRLARVLPCRRATRRRASDVALVLSRGFAGTNAALVVRAHRGVIVRWRTAPRPPVAAESTRSRSPASSGCCARRRRRIWRALLGAGAARRRRRAGPRGEPRRALRREGGLRQAVPARGGARAARAADFAVARDNYGAPQVVLQPARGGPRRALSPRGHRAVDDARPDQRIRGSAGAARARRCRLAGKLLYRLLPFPPRA